MSDHTITIDESHRQLILLALAQLSLERPGWEEALRETASQLPDGEVMYAEFRTINRDTATGLLAAAKLILSSPRHGNTPSEEAVEALRVAVARAEQRAR